MTSTSRNTSTITLSTALIIGAGVFWAINNGLLPWMHTVMGSEPDHAPSVPFQIDRILSTTDLVTSLVFVMLTMPLATALIIVIRRYLLNEDPTPWYQGALVLIIAIGWIGSAITFNSEINRHENGPASASAQFADWSKARYDVDLEAFTPGDLEKLYASGDGFHQIFDPASRQLITTYTNSEGTILVSIDNRSSSVLYSNSGGSIRGYTEDSESVFELPWTF